MPATFNEMRSRKKQPLLSPGDGRIREKIRGQTAAPWPAGVVRAGLLCLPQLAACGKMVRAARDAELPWDKSPLVSLALGSGPGGSLPVASSTLVRLRVHALTADPRAAR